MKYNSAVVSVSHSKRETVCVLLSAGFSVCEDGKRQVCEEAVLPVLVDLLRDEDIEVQANAAGVIMNTVIITTGTNTRLFQPHSFCRAERQSVISSVIGCLLVKCTLGGFVSTDFLSL